MEPIVVELPETAASIKLSHTEDREFVMFAYADEFEPEAQPFLIPRKRVGALMHALARVAREVNPSMAEV